MFELLLNIKDFGLTWVVLYPIVLIYELIQQAIECSYRRKNDLLLILFIAAMCCVGGSLTTISENYGIFWGNLSEVIAPTSNTTQTFIKITGGAIPLSHIAVAIGFYLNLYSLGYFYRNSRFPCNEKDAADLANKLNQKINPKINVRDLTLDLDLDEDLDLDTTDNPKIKISFKEINALYLFATEQLDSGSLDPETHKILSRSLDRFLSGKLKGYESIKSYRKNYEIKKMDEARQHKLDKMKLKKINHKITYLKKIEAGENVSLIFTHEQEELIKHIKSDFSKQMKESNNIQITFPNITFPKLLSSLRCAILHEISHSENNPYGKNKEKLKTYIDDSMKEINSWYPNDSDSDNSFSIDLSSSTQKKFTRLSMSVNLQKLDSFDLEWNPDYNIKLPNLSKDQSAFLTAIKRKIISKISNCDLSDRKKTAFKITLTAIFNNLHFGFLLQSMTLLLVNHLKNNSRKSKEEIKQIRIASNKYLTNIANWYDAKTKDKDTHLLQADYDSEEEDNDLIQNITNKYDPFFQRTKEQQNSHLDNLYPSRRKLPPKKVTPRKQAEKNLNLTGKNKPLDTPKLNQIEQGNMRLNGLIERITEQQNHIEKDLNTARNKKEELSKKDNKNHEIIEIENKNGTKRKIHRLSRSASLGSL